MKTMRSEYPVKAVMPFDEDATYENFDAQKATEKMRQAMLDIEAKGWVIRAAFYALPLFEKDAGLADTTLFFVCENDPATYRRLKGNDSSKESRRRDVSDLWK